MSKLEGRSESPDIGEELSRAISTMLTKPWRAIAAGLRIGPYRLEEKLASGGYAEVWKGRHNITGDLVAVKIFTPESFLEAHRDRAAKRFCIGAKAMSQLRGRHGIISIYEGPEFTDSYLWFSMALHERDLDRAIRSGALSTSDKFHIFDQLLASVKEAHSEGIVHRDIRPKNVLLSSIPGKTAQCVTLTDFDIAYYDQWLLPKPYTEEVIGVIRYLPWDLLTVGKESPPGPNAASNAGAPASAGGNKPSSQSRLQTAMRRPSNDYYALCVLLYDLFWFKGDFPDLPTPPLDFGLLMKSLKEADPSLSRTMRRRVCRVIHGGLAQHESKRFRKLTDLQRAWSGAQAATSKSVGMTGLLLLGLITTSGLFFDLGLYAEPNSITRALSSLLSALVVVALTIAGGAGIVAYGKAQLLDVQIAISDFVQRRPWSSWFIVLSVWLVAPATWYAFTRPRIGTYWIAHADQCAIVNSNDANTKARLIGNARLHIVSLADGDYLQCKADVEPSVEWYQRTYFAPNIKVAHVRPPPAVDAVPPAEPPAVKPPIDPPKVWAAIR
jgi:serine/threonine protein kinase